MMLILVRIGALLLAFFKVGIQGEFELENQLGSNKEGPQYFLTSHLAFSNHDALS